MNYSDLLRMNGELKKTMKGKPYNIKVLSNIITYQINDILEYVLRTCGINAFVKSGNYDNIVQDSTGCGDTDLVVIFWELANLIDGLQYKANLMSREDLDMLLARTKSEIDLVLRSLQTRPLVLMNLFSAAVFNNHATGQSVLDIIADELNEYIRGKAPVNVILIDINKAIAEVSVQKSVDMRYYYSSKALYSAELYLNYAERIKPIILSANGKAKKALILDCDNTLWKGVVGEDGLTGLEMSGKTRQGAIFEEVQSLTLDLKNKGILIGLCSKNNAADVDEVLAKHPDMRIRESDIAVKKVNWDSKVDNLKAIAVSLNIGLDSLVFIEDSDFEANYVRGALPEVTVMQVPVKLHEYPDMLRSAANLFYNVSGSREDARRTDMYREQAQRDSARHKYGTIAEYLASLELKINVTANDPACVSRVSQLTQKTNQFNLTTKRYTEADIQKFLTDGRHKIFTAQVNDKFGDYGITALCIVALGGKKKPAFIDTLLMSCRVIGRGIEYALIDLVVDDLKKMGVESLDAAYAGTAKNGQVAAFYDKLGFIPGPVSGTEKLYNLKISEYKANNVKHMGGVFHGR